jgi:PAS domain S-box-containing protein
MTKLVRHENSTNILKDRILELEQKLVESEATISSLRSEVSQLKLAEKNGDLIGNPYETQQNELLEAVIDHSLVGIAIISGADLIFKIANHTYRTITPDPKINPVGRKWKEIWTGESGIKVETILRHVLETGETIHSDYHTRRFPDGSLHHYILNLSRITLDSEHVVLSMIWETTQLINARGKAEKILQEQNQLLTALKEGEERFRKSVDVLPDGFTILTAIRETTKRQSNSRIINFKYDYVNDTGCQLYQLPREEIVGRSLLEIQPEADLFNDLVELVETGQPIIKETLRYQKNLAREEERFYQIFDTRAVKLGDGVVMIWRDVTSRVVGEKKLREALQALQESEHRLDLAHKAAGLGSWNWKFGDSYAICSETFFQLHGLEVPTDKKLDLEQYLSMVHPSDASRVRELTLKAIQIIDVGTIEDNEFRFIQPNGPIRWMAVYQKAIHDGSTLVGISGVTMDITNRKRAERKIQRSEEHLRSVLDTIFSFVGVLNSEGILLEINKAPLEAAGISLKDVHYKRFEETYWWDYSPEIKRQLRQAIDKAAQGEVSRYDVQIRVKDGRFIFIDFMIAPMFDEAGRVEYLIPSAVDITARKEAEEALHRYAEQLKRSNQELEQFAFIASHDLQEPLRKIEMFSKALLENSLTHLDDQQEDFLHRMEQAAGRMRAMITDLLNLSRVTTQAKPFVSTDLNQIVSDALSDLEERIKTTKGIVEISDLPTIKADPIQMKQLFLNLISNALKFHKSEILPVVRITYRNLSANSIQILIEDNGIGFDTSQLEAAFQPFRRLVGRSKYEGSGIGLAICRKIAERHGGSITAESNPGEGSVFVVTLPTNNPYIKRNSDEDSDC